MDFDLYNKIKEYKISGSLPNISRFSKLRFQKHYQAWVVKDNKLYFENKLVISSGNIQSILKELYKDPNITSNSLHSFFDIVKLRYVGITFNQVSDFLRNCENYQLHKPVKAVKVIKPIIRSISGNYIQADTINLTEFSHINHGYSYD
jgi:hypothetical protein